MSKFTEDDLKKELETKIESCSEQVQKITDNSSDVRLEIETQITAQNELFEEANKINNKIASNKELEKEIKDIRKKEKSFNKDWEEIDGKIQDLCDFNKEKTLELSDKISESFNGIKFRMFRPRFKGEDEECCEVLGDNGIDFPGSKMEKKACKRLGIRCSSWVVSGHN